MQAKSVVYSDSNVVLEPKFSGAYFCRKGKKRWIFTILKNCQYLACLGWQILYFQVKVIDTVEVFIGWEWEARILERFCEYTVDGVPGWGVSEWHYRHFGGRPQKYEDQDPPEVKDVPKYWQVTPKQNISEIYIQYGSVMKRCLFRHLTPYTFFLSSHVVQVQVFFRKEIIRFTAQRFPYHKLPLLLSTKMLFRAADTHLYLLHTMKIC